MATLGTTFGLIALAMGGKEKAAKEQGPPINAASKDEEAFIQFVHPLLQYYISPKRLLNVLTESS